MSDVPESFNSVSSPKEESEDKPIEVRTCSLRDLLEFFEGCSERSKDWPIMIKCSDSDFLYTLDSSHVGAFENPKKNFYLLMITKTELKTIASEGSVSIYEEDDKCLD